MTSTPPYRSLAVALGPGNPAILRVIRRLEDIYNETESLAPVDGSYRAWSACQPFDGDSSAEAFVRHTCLSLMCRFLAYRFLEPRPSERDLWDAISGDYFVGAGLGNFLGEDFFSWPFFRLSMGIGDDAPSMDAARMLMSTLGSLDFDQPPPGLLSALYWEYRGNTGNLDSQATVEASLSLLEEDPYLSCLSPYCGDGAALAGAVRTVVTTRIAAGQFPMDGLLEVSAQFLGMTSDPLAATVASLAFLLALGEEVTEPHPPILIPVYMADAGQMPTERSNGEVEKSYVIEAANGVTLPEKVAADPLYLDWLFGRFPNYQRGAALRLRAQQEDEAVQEVLNAWYNYLTSPKARTPIPEPLTPGAADVMVEAGRRLIVGYIHGSGPGPLHLIRNAPAPLFAARRQFDLTI